MKYLIFSILVLFFCSCEQIYFQPDLIEGACYVFEPPSVYEYTGVDTMVLVKIEDDYIQTINNKGFYVKYKKQNFSYYLRPVNNYNCSCNGNK